MQAKKIVLQRIKSETHDRGFFDASTDAFQGFDAVIISCGPSAARIGELIPRFDPEKTIFITVKHAQELVPDPDFVLYNSFNIKKLKRKASPHMMLYAEAENLRARSRHGPNFNSYDVRFEVCKTPGGNTAKSIAADPNMSGLALPSNGFLTWGPGIMYELAIPLALHLGVKSVHTIGWELFASADANPHFYDPNPSSSRPFMLGQDSLISRASSRLGLRWPINTVRNVVLHAMGRTYNVVTPKAGESALIAKSLAALDRKVTQKGREMIIWQHDGMKFLGSRPQDTLPPNNTCVPNEIS